MAVDTARKRLSMMDFDNPSAPNLPPPDGSFSSGDRMHLLWLYSGIQEPTEGASLVRDRLSIPIGIGL